MRSVLLLIGAIVGQTVASTYLDIIGMPGVWWPAVVQGGAAAVGMLVVLGIEWGIGRLRRPQVVSSPPRPPKAGLPFQSREAFQKQHRLLLIGITALWLLSVGLTLGGIAPIVPDVVVHDAIPATVCAIMLLGAWLWARPKVPFRASTVVEETFWQDERVGAPAALLIFLLEGSATLAAVWTMVSGSWLTGFVSLLGILSLAVNGPHHLERRVVSGSPG